MRLKVILCALAVALGLLAPAIYFRFFKPLPVPLAQPVVSADATPVAAPPAIPAIAQRVAGASQARNHDGVESSQEPGDGATPEEHEAYVQQRLVALVEMGRNRNPASLQAILADVHNSDPQIRSAALSATMEFGNTNAIPALKNEMGWTDDLHEKVQIQKAIDYLEIPPVAFDEKNRIIPLPGE